MSEHWIGLANLRVATLSLDTECDGCLLYAAGAFCTAVMDVSS